MHQHLSLESLGRPQLSISARHVINMRACGGPDKPPAQLRYVESWCQRFFFLHICHMRPPAGAPEVPRAKAAGGGMTLTTLLE
jgi:hypothetical protein